MSLLKRDMTRLRSSFLDIFIFFNSSRGFVNLSSHRGLPVSVPTEAAEDGLGVGEAGEAQLKMEY